ncbi:hypothetical protein [Ferrimonas balearica]|uniref:hypothetical protein n=1 Tax=Ferrimonas balearica TaxID=44012 RepID=UPI001C99D2C8|nr:hypothetical protein [Ferrimonas balearica]MBY5993955.1 hypothetical protein [Ferrimonas balearica]
MIAIAQLFFLTLGLALVVVAVGLYLRRTANWHALWQIWVGKLKDLSLSEFRFYRSGILFLFIGILLRIVNLTLNGV